MPIVRQRWPSYLRFGDPFSTSLQRLNNETAQESKTTTPSYTCVFLADRKKKIAIKGSCLRYFLRVCNRWTELDETWQETSTQRPVQSLCFLVWSKNQDSRPACIGSYILTFSLESQPEWPSWDTQKSRWSHVLLFAEQFLNSSLQLLKRIEQNFTGHDSHRSWHTFSRRFQGVLRFIFKEFEGLSCSFNNPFAKQRSTMNPFKLSVQNTQNKKFKDC